MDSGTIRHATCNGFQFRYDFGGKHDCLVITSPTTTTGGLLLSWMLSWRAGEQFRVEQLREDATYGIGTRQPATLAQFPLADALAALALRLLKSHRRIARVC